MEAKEYFSLNPAQYAKSYSEETAEGYSFRIRKERLLELLGKGPGRVLDIGCGPAVMTKDIIDLGWTYEGTDISDAMVHEAKKKFPDISFSIGVVENIPVSAETYDSVVAMGLVEYVEDDERAIREVARVLKPSGRFFVSLPNWWSPARVWDRVAIAPIGKFIRLLTKRSKPNVFHREYRSAEYAALLKKNGFSVKKTIYYNFRVLPRPLDYWFPTLATLSARLLEPLRATPLRFIGTGFIIEAVRR